jgi:3-oxoacyl-ACP reductase-like protein
MAKKKAVKPKEEKKAVPEPKQEAPVPAQSAQSAEPAPAPAAEQAAPPALALRIKDLMKAWWSSPVAKALVGDRAVSGLSDIDALAPEATLESVGLEGQALEAMLARLTIDFGVGVIELRADPKPTFADLVNLVTSRLKDAGLL